MKVTNNCEVSSLCDVTIRCTLPDNTFLQASYCKAKTTSKNDTKLNIGQRRNTSMVDKNSAKTPMNIKLSLYFTIIFIYAADILSVSHITLITI